MIRRAITGATAAWIALVDAALTLLILAVLVARSRLSRRRSLRHER